MIDLQEWPIPVPTSFQQVQYKGMRIPGVAKQSDLSLGANCQVYAYEILGFYGLKIPNFRSSDLWEDELHTQKVEQTLQPLDLVLYHRKAEAFGAHIGLYWGDGLVLHLAKHNGLPKVESHESLLQIEKYAYFIGAKRVKTISSR